MRLQALPILLLKELLSEIYPLEVILINCIGNYAENSEVQPQRFVDPVGDLDQMDPDFDFEEAHLCAVDNTISEFINQMGPLGNELYDAVVSLDVTPTRHSITMLGQLLYHFAAFLTYKNKKVGVNYPNKAFNAYILNELFSSPKLATEKYDHFVSVRIIW